MRKRWVVLSSVLLVLLFLSTVPAQAAAVQKPWSPGWDVFTVTSNNSKVIFNHPNGTSNLHIDYIMKGTNVPNTVHRVGFHLFWTSTSQCVTNFGHKVGQSGGTLTHSNCDTATRQAKTHVFESFELGDLAVNAAGNGTLSAEIHNVPAGTYKLEFHFRIAACTFCDVELQSPGPTFGESGSIVTITIP